MTDVSYLGRRSPAELRAQAARCRHAAKSARVVDVREALIAIAARFDDLADRREQEHRLDGSVGDE
jgi:hypothetical protein